MVMKVVLKKVLSQDADVEKGTSAYIDDTLVNEDVVKASRVVEHLKSYGLLSKSPERVTDGARVLGLRVWREHGQLVWRRDNEMDDMPSVLSRRSVFSYCGKLVSHYPVCGWLRVATAYIKRMANDCMKGWNDVITNEELRKYQQEAVNEVRNGDPVRGRWDVKGDSESLGGCQLHGVWCCCGGGWVCRGRHQLVTEGFVMSHQQGRTGCHNQMTQLGLGVESKNSGLTD